MKLTKIALALVAVLAMSALAASGASAAEYKSANTSPVSLFGEDNGNHQFTVDGQAVTCTNATFNKASQAVPTKNITGVTAAYNNCTAFGFAGATVNMGNCTYTFKEPVLVAGNEYKANTGIFCNSGSANVNVSVFGSECSVAIGQSGNENLSHVKIVNQANAPKDVLLTATVNSITVTKNKDNGLCPLSGTGTVTNGTYNGPTTVKDNEGKGILVG